MNASRPLSAGTRRKQHRNDRNTETASVEQGEVLFQQKIQRHAVRFGEISPKVAADQEGQQSRRRRDADGISPPAESGRQRRRVEQERNENAGTQKIGHESKPFHSNRRQIVAERGQDQRDDYGVGHGPVRDAPASRRQGGQKEQPRRQHGNVRQIRGDAEAENCRQQNRRDEKDNSTG